MANACTSRLTHSSHFFIIFHRQAALLLIHLARHYCDENASWETRKIDLNLGWLFLLANDFLSLIDSEIFVEGDDENNRAKASAHITRQYLLNFTPQERYSLPRSWLIFHGLKSQIPDKKRMDVSALMKAKRGFDIDEYYLILNTLYIYWGDQKIDKWNSRHVVINPTTVFDKIKTSPEKYVSILDSLSVDVRPTKILPALTDLEGWRKEIYEHFELRLKPLIKINGVYLCADINFIRGAYWEGPYHIILTDYARTKISSKVLNYLGEATEKYIQHMGKDAFGDKFFLEDCGNGNPLGDGVIQLQDDWIVVVESKAARPGIDLVSGSKPITSLSDFNKLVEHGLAQMSERIADYRKHKGYSGRISPFLVTAGYTPQHDIIWQLMIEKLKHLYIFQDSNCDFPFLLDIECWDVICATRKNGMNLEDIINLRLQDHATKTSNPHFFLYAKIFDALKRPEPTHPELISLYLDLYGNLIHEYFKSNMGNRPYPPDIWKSIFRI